MGPLFFVIFGAVLAAGALLYAWHQSQVDIREIKASTAERIKASDEALRNYRACKARAAQLGYDSLQVCK
ncbi:hypothetical protein B0E52_05555 [Rhodanobacter sp. C06]|nr:hypothetical protein B0E52_05555 [Rhodanobacter sp. C06]